MRDFSLGCYGNILIIQLTDLHSWKFPQGECFIIQCKLSLFTWNCDCHCIQLEIYIRRGQPRLVMCTQSLQVQCYCRLNKLLPIPQLAPPHVQAQGTWRLWFTEDWQSSTLELIWSGACIDLSLCHSKCGLQL